MLLLVAVVACAGCDTIRQPSAMVAEWTTSWREAATTADKARLREWRTTFVNALSAARKSGHAEDVAREGALLEPDAALGGADLTDGQYRCRVIKLGAKGPGMLDYVSYPWFACRVKPERDLHRLTKQTGSQRYVGLIFPGDPLRDIFLGTLVLGDEARALQYGQDATRDVAGYVERIGPARWRLLMPQPAFESQMDVMELVPASGGTR